MKGPARSPRPGPQNTSRGEVEQTRAPTRCLALSRFGWFCRRSPPPSPPKCMYKTPERIQNFSSDERKLDPDGNEWNSFSRLQCRSSCCNWRLC
ncbi:hypothetical protein EXIGLDRAFT_732292 [Exidia glandulosa HHB12029]|uniref:Uncharacterized protein n=1 Tax=Exidia glandulosa HHB12029 TaxID=1314781 RepID=A0A165BKF6_EXIGL|nr:hypothetical protein EXIGLDRAFT_732292 [Exidia glandulosa HHB12029]